MNKTKSDGSFNSEFWRSFDKLGIYSKEDGPLLADQDDAPVTGGSNASDSDKKTNETNEQFNDNSLGDSNSLNNSGLDTGSSSDNSSDMSGDMNSSNGSSEVDTSSDSGASNNEPTDPNENPFKTKNGKSLLDAKLAELQAAITDTLRRIYANPKLNTVVVSELENLQDSVRNIRETIFMIPIENTVYKYKLAVTSYAALSKEIVTDVVKSEQDN